MSTALSTVPRAKRKRTGTPPKWEPGEERVLTYGDFESCVKAQSVLYVDRFFKGRAVSATVIANMSYWLVTRLIQNGRIRRGRITEAYSDWLREEIFG